MNVLGPLLHLTRGALLSEDAFPSSERRIIAPRELATKGLIAAGTIKASP